MTTNQQGIVPDPASSSTNRQTSRAQRLDTNHRRRNQQDRNNRRYAPRASKFEGQTPELKGHIYDT
eukprot:9373744-Ditylum_brightwellii.AAC.1